MIISHFKLCVLIPCRFSVGLLEWVQAYRLLRKQFPSPPTDSLLLGHASQMQKPHHHRWLCKMTKDFGDKFYMRMAHNHVINFAAPLYMFA